MTTGLETKFNENLAEWEKHLKSKSHMSFSQAKLDCDSYKEIINLGVESLPLIRDQLSKEIETSKKYEDKLGNIKMRVFGNGFVNLHGDNYTKISKDKEFQQHQEGYGTDIIGHPGHLWAYAVHEIVGEDFDMLLNENSSVQKVGNFINFNVDDLQKFTLNWLDDNMNNYLNPINKL